MNLKKQGWYCLINGLKWSLPRTLIQWILLKLTSNVKVLKENIERNQSKWF